MSRPEHFPEQNKGFLGLEKSFNNVHRFHTATGLFSILQCLNEFKIRDRVIAHTLCQLIPSQSPFEQDITLLGRTFFHISLLCKSNPFYAEVVAL